MKPQLLFAVVAALVIPAIADAGVTVQIGQPGFYGTIDVGGYPQPQLIYPEPVLIQPVPVGVVAPPPIYVHVPPGHAKDWGKHCKKYGACGRPVYFVSESWYEHEYVPHYQKVHGKPHHKKH